MSSERNIRNFLWIKANNRSFFFLFLCSLFWYISGFIYLGNIFMFNVCRLLVLDFSIRAQCIRLFIVMYSVIYSDVILVYFPSFL